jgi:hypothetical protein
LIEPERARFMVECLEEPAAREDEAAGPSQSGDRKRIAPLIELIQRHAMRERAILLARLLRNGLAIDADVGAAEVGAVHIALRRKSGMSGALAPLPAGRQLDEVASLVGGARLSGGPIGCGVSLSRLMRVASLGSTALNGMAIRAKRSAPRRASSRSPHDQRALVSGVRRW